MAPERDGEGKVTSFLATCTDITRLRRTQEALRLASKHESLGLLAGNIANDFNNILQAVWTSLDLMESFPGDQAQARKALEWARDSLRKGKRITQFIHEYSGKGACQPVTIDLAGQVAGFAATQVPTEPIGLEVEAAESLPLVPLDPAQLESSLKAMVANAVEAIGSRRGTVRVVVRRPGSFNARKGVWILRPQPGEAVEMVVENDGPSIPRDMLHRIFDPYYTTKEMGRGLGLASVLGVVRTHKGGLWVESVQGAGVRIRILWPVAGRAVASLAPLSDRPGAILVVDDEQPVLEVVSRILEEMVGRPVLLASGGAEAMEIIKARGEGISVVLMDANMPGLDGTEAFERIRSLYPEMPGLLFSGCEKAQGLELARTFGFTGFIKKPFEVDDLRAAFAAMIPPGKQD